jgi:hypothetical protein
MLDPGHGRLDLAGHMESGARPRRTGGAELDRASHRDLDRASHRELDPTAQTMVSSEESHGAEDAGKRMKASGAWEKSAAARLADRRRTARERGPGM